LEAFTNLNKEEQIFGVIDEKYIKKSILQLLRYSNADIIYYGFHQRKELLKQIYIDSRVINLT